MLKQIALWLADCSVGQKLLLGFGLVSVLAVAAIAQGLYATVTLLGHSREVSVMVDINRTTLQMRNTEKDYALDPSPQVGQKVWDLMLELEAQLQMLEQQATGEDLSVLVAMQQSVGAYREQFSSSAATSAWPLRRCGICRSRPNRPVWSLNWSSWICMTRFAPY